VETNSSFNRYLQNQEPEGLSFKIIKSKIFKNWLVFAVFGFVGIFAAFIIYKISPPSYKIASTILIKNDGKTTELNNVFRELNVNKSNPVIQDQVGVLKSYNLNFKTMQYFDWRYSWFKKDWFIAKDLYGNDPFELVQADEVLQTENVRLSVNPISEKEYLLECDEKVTINGSKTHINFEQKLKFGETFKNKYFQFILNAKPGIPIEVGEVYYLVFNNINQQELSYKEKLEVKTVNVT